ncbi:hypothetical protein [Nitratifractor sp.]|uniref:hypothetical protein n=1 Tax=Nitratifractor sp. TaxID=2268144 RepID=UPI0025E009E1|nr:hypothetical protein [Nitratifractor sp.]
MIHAHHFFFTDLPGLQEEYEAFGFARVEDESQAVIVRELEWHAGFERRNGLRSMSGRLCYYLSDGDFGTSRGRGDWGLEVQEVLSLVWDAEHRNISYGKGPRFTPELLRFWIWHTFFPITLALEGEYMPMHVGAVEIDGAPVLFSAASFGGKSTLTDHFLQKGHALYSDDTLPIKRVGDDYLAYPSFPYHRPYRRPETLGEPFGNFARQPAPVRAIFELIPAAPDAAVTVTPVRGVERFNILHQSQFVRFAFLKHRRYAFALEMAKVVPVFQLTVPWDLKRLDEVYEAVRRHLETL